VKSAVHVFLGDRDHQPEVGFHQILLGALGFGLTVTDHGKGMPQLGQSGAAAASRFRSSFFSSFARGCCAGLFLASSFLISLSRWLMFIHSALDFAGELLPFDEPERNTANRQGGFHFGAIQPGAQPLAGFLVGRGGAVHLVLQLLELLVEKITSGELFGRLSPDLQIAGSLPPRPPDPRYSPTSMVAFFNCSARSTTTCCTRAERLSPSHP